jgi:hypothetical protein
MRGNDPQDGLCDCITSLFTLPLADVDELSPIPHTSAGLGLSYMTYPGRRRPHEIDGDYLARTDLIRLGIPTHLVPYSVNSHFENWTWPTVEDYFSFLQEEYSRVPAAPLSPIRRRVVTVVPPHLEGVARNFRLRYPNESMSDYIAQLERRAALYDDDHSFTPNPWTLWFIRFVAGVIFFCVVIGYAFYSRVKAYFTTPSPL